MSDIDPNDAMLRATRASQGQPMDAEPRRAAPADTQEALDAKGLESSTTAFSQEQLAKLAFAIFYSANLCAPQNIEAVVKEIDTCGNDCEHARGSHCQRGERGDYCPFSLAEDLRQISAALFGPRDPSHYVPSVFGPECMTAFRATTPAPGEGEAVVKPLEWRHYPDAFPPMWCAKASIGSYSIEETAGSDGPSYDVVNPSMTTIANFDGLPEAKAAAQADYDRRIRSALAAPSYAQPAPRADLVEALQKSALAHEQTAKMLREIAGIEIGVVVAPAHSIAFTAHKAAIAALSEAPREAEGWKLVPVEFIEFVKNAPVSSGVCCCGGGMGHSPHDGHSPVDQWDYSLRCWLDQISAAPKREG